MFHTEQKYEIFEGQTVKEYVCRLKSMEDLEDGRS